MPVGAIHKGRPHPRGRGGSQKPTHADAGGGGQWQNADVLWESTIFLYDYLIRHTNIFLYVLCALRGLEIDMILYIGFKCP